MNKSAPIARRKPLLALLAALLMPGLGQLYNGQINKGFFVLLTFISSVPLSALASLYLSEHLLLILLILGVLCAFGAYGYGLVDSYRVARQLGKDYQLRSYNHASAYIAALLFGYIALNALTHYTRQHFVEAFKIPSQSMMPSVMQGDFLFADKRVNCPGCKHHIKRGDIVILVYPNNRTLLYIKRVIALPGDTVELSHQMVRVNGQSIQGHEIKNLGNNSLNSWLETHLAYYEQGESGNYPVFWKKGEMTEKVTITVSNGQVFVLGDNRNATSDSRDFGTVPLVDIIGKAKQIWFSWDVENHRIRWERLGLSLEVK
jgi:signal peptidase I